MASIFIANLLRFKQENYVPDRDIILALTADEEGGPANGVRWLHRQSPRPDRRRVRAQRRRRRLAARRQAVHQLRRRGGEGLGELHGVDGESRRTLVGAARRQRDLRARAGARRTSATYQFPVMLNEVTTRVLHEHGDDRDAGDRRRDARDRRESERRRGVGDDLDATRATARCCARRASRRCSPAGTRATRCRRRRRANVNCRMAPGHDPADVRAAL